MNKHADDYVFGMDKDIQNKMRAKFEQNAGKQLQAQEWIGALVEGLVFSQSEDNMERVQKMQEILKDGVVLCTLLNMIKPDSVKKINNTKMVFKQRENIVNYIEGCKAMGMPETDCFVTQDLFEGDNMLAVIDQIFALGSLSKTIATYTGPTLGVKTADKNIREFSEEVLNQVSIPQTSLGSIAIEKNKGTDSIVLYGKIGIEMGKSVGGVSQQNAGSIPIEREKGTDAIVKYGKVGQEMGISQGGVSQLHEGSIATEKHGNLDSLTRNIN